MHIKLISNVLMQCQVGNAYENVHKNIRFSSRTSDNINRLGWVQDWGNFQRAESGCMPLAVFRDIRLGASLRLILKGQGQVKDPGFLLFLEGMRLGASFNFQTDKARCKSRIKKSGESTRQFLKG